MADDLEFKKPSTREVKKKVFGSCTLADPSCTLQGQGSGVGRGTYVHLCARSLKVQFP